MFVQILCRVKSGESTTRNDHPGFRHFLRYLGSAEIYKLPQRRYYFSFPVSCQSLILASRHSLPDQLSVLSAYCLPRFISDRNQVRRSVSSIQTSIRLAVATSRCSSHTLCASRRRAASVLLSSASSAIMSRGSTYS